MIVIDCYGPFSLQLPIKIIQIWPMAAMGYFHYNSLSKSLIWPVKAMGHFNYNSLSQSLKYELWQLWAISFTIPYQIHWYMTYGSYGPFPLQLLIKIIEIWPMTTMGHSLYNSLSKSLKYDLWQLWAIVVIGHISMIFIRSCNGNCK